MKDLFVISSTARTVGVKIFRIRTLAVVLNSPIIDVSKSVFYFRRRTRENITE